MMDLYQYLLQFTSRLQLFNKAFRRLGVDKLSFSPTLGPLCSESTLLVSGSCPFYSRIMNNHLVTNKRSAYICDTPYTKASLPACSHPLQRIKHWQVGGATSFVALVGHSDPSLRPHKSKLQRTLKHFIDYSLRPTALNRFSTSPTYSCESKRLPIPLVHEYVGHATHFCASGYGIRKLIFSELGSLFGLDVDLIGSTTITSYPLPPVQILDSVLHPFLTPVPRDPPSTMLTLPPVIPPTGTYLPILRKTLPLSWSQVDYLADKAAKDDDAEPVFRHWEDRIRLVLPHTTSILPWLRRRLMHKLYRRLWLEFTAYLRSKYGHFHRLLARSNKTIRGGRLHQLDPADPIVEFSKDRVAGLLVVQRYCESSFLSWDNGSALIFWRWPLHLQQIARDGFTPFIHGALPRNKRMQRPIVEDLRPLFFSKLYKFISKSYISPSSALNVIRSKVDYFPVPKGDHDLRPVFNGTSCQLNKVVFAPNFWLPMADSLLMCLTFNYKMVDIDLGEMFNLFPLHYSLQAVSGIDLTHFRKQIEEFFPHHITSNPSLLYSWSRVWMGLRPAPYWSCRYYYLLEEFVVGDITDSTNVFAWDEVILNLPGSPSFNPTLPFVMRWDSHHTRIASSIKAYVDDLRITGATIELAWQAARQTAARLQYLGVQDAPRKRRLDHGPWSGTVFSTDNHKVTKSVTKTKWIKAKTYVQDLLAEHEQDPNNSYSFKRLEKIRGFFCHLAITYSIIFPYLKGFHLTLCQHLSHRNEDGWKLNDSEWLGYIEVKAEKDGLSNEAKQNLIDQLSEADVKPPRVVTPVKRFWECLYALQKLFEPEDPPAVNIRSDKVYLAVYGFLDASGSGFGCSLQREDQLSFRVGVWGSDQDDSTSNWREFGNIVEALEEEETLGSLDGAFVVLATDNKTVESCLYKGNSSSPKLYELILRFKALELRTGSRFIVSHVSGERMKKQGTDGLSRGSMSEGVAAGQSMLGFCPWHISALERNSQLKDWIVSWAGKDAEFLSPEQWFHRGHDLIKGTKLNGFYWPGVKPGTFVWSPPPGAADVAVEELRKARLKRQQSVHVMVIPKLMTTMWQKQFYKAMDAVIEISPDNLFWSKSELEPLFLGICLPYASHFPWIVRNTPKAYQVGRDVRRLLPEQDLAARNILRKFLVEGRKLPSMPPDVVRQVLYFAKSTRIPSYESSHTKIQRGPNKKRSAVECLEKGPSTKRRVSSR